MNCLLKLIKFKKNCMFLILFRVNHLKIKEIFFKLILMLFCPTIYFK